MNRYDGLDGARVLITGAAKGLGAALAAGFAAQGSHLALVDIDEAALDATAGPLRSEGSMLWTETYDLAMVDGCEALVDRAAAALGGLDILVNNAAVIGRMPLAAITPEAFEHLLRVNLQAPLFLARAAMLIMRRRGRGGRVIDVASMAARTGGVSDVAMYAASKGGLVAITKALAREGAADGILVNAILPSNIDSPMLRDAFPPAVVERTLSQVPLGRMARPEEVVELVLWLASDASSYVTGAAWDINGGWHMT